jgi:hypothetical protein
MITGVLAAARGRRGETVGLRFEPSDCMVFPYNAQSLARDDVVSARATKMTDDLTGGTL